MSFSPVLALYRAASVAAGAFASLALNIRAGRGKEDPARLQERFARYSQSRPAGRLMWLHAASVGESGVALALIEAMGARDPALSFLLSTGTRTSAALAARRAAPRTIHIYAPIDRPDVTKRFVEWWSPDVGVFIESELWPNTILAARNSGVPLALVNARMSPSTIGRWMRWRAAGAHLVRAFTIVSAADARTAQALSTLSGRQAPATGNLKLAAPTPRIEPAARAALAEAIGKRPVWVAASTHEGEDELALAAHAQVRSHFPDALLIIVPRHPERGEALAALTGGAPRRARFEPIGAAPVYIADTLGELGLIYDLAPVTLVAGSLLPHLKGHNPIEPAKLDAAIISGPHVESFDDLFKTLFSAGAALCVPDAPALGQAVIRLLSDEPARARQLEAARAIAAQGADAFDDTVAQLLALAPAQARVRSDAPA